MRETLSLIVGIFVTLFIVLSIVWIVQGNDFFLYKVFAPKYEDARRQVFENSKAFNQGMIQELSNMQYEYIKASPDHQQALGSIILHRSADYNLDQPQVPADLRKFIGDLRRERSSQR